MNYRRGFQRVYLLASLAWVVAAFFGVQAYQASFWADPNYPDDWVTVPPGYTLDQPAPRVPPGYTLVQPAPSKPSATVSSFGDPVAPAGTQTQAGQNAGGDWFAANAPTAQPQSGGSPPNSKFGGIPVVSQADQFMESERTRINWLSKLSLSEADRSRLDGIVQQMKAENKSDAEIQTLVNDFKEKYGKSKSPLYVVESQPLPISPFGDKPVQQTPKQKGQYSASDIAPDTPPNSPPSILRFRVGKALWLAGVLILPPAFGYFLLFFVMSWVIRGFTN